PERADRFIGTSADSGRSLWVGSWTGLRANGRFRCTQADRPRKPIEIICGTGHDRECRDFGLIPWGISHEEFLKLRIAICVGLEIYPPFSTHAELTEMPERGNHWPDDLRAGSQPSFDRKPRKLLGGLPCLRRRRNRQEVVNALTVRPAAYTWSRPGLV